MKKKMTVIGQYNDGQVYVEGVSASSIPEAIRAAIIIDPSRADAEVLFVLKGRVEEVDPDFELGWLTDLPGVLEWECPDCHRRYDRYDLPNECECGHRVRVVEEELY